MINRFKQHLRSFKKLLKYGGFKRKCPICNSGAKKFLCFGIVPREDAMCPFCGALERHRLFWLYILRRTSFHSAPPQRALHIAPEAVIEKKLRPLIGAGYLTADLYGENVDIKMDITDIQFPDNSFDFIYCSHVLEHVPDDRQAMREIHRVLSEGGTAVLLVPVTVDKTIEDPSITDPDERLRLFGQKDHVRRYGADFALRLREEGFVVDVVSCGDFLSFKEIEKMGITAAAGELYICKK